LDKASAFSIGIFSAPGLDLLLCILTFIILQSFKSFESVLLLMLAYVGQFFMLHSCDLVSFYVCLEAQNFCFLVLCGLQPKLNAPTASNASHASHAKGSAASASASASASTMNLSSSSGLRYDLSSGSALFSVEASLKFLILSAFSSGVILF
jgi:NADH:ubiquinone oxidoreductase subunit 2 (subunit N)